MNTIMRTQLAAMKDAGFTVTCVCDDDEWTPAIRGLGVRVLPLGMGRRPGPLRGVLWALRFYRLLRRERADIVHTHNAFHGLLGRPAARLAGVPVVVQTIHNWWYLEPEGSIRARLYRRLERIAARFCDAVLFINQEDVRRAASARIVDPARTHFIGNGVNTRDLDRRLAERTRENERTRLGIGAAEVVIAMVARLEHPKDHVTLLRAFARVAAALDNTRLLLVGQGLEEGHVKDLAATLGIESRVTFLGHVSDIAGVLRATDILVLSSHCEGFGRCLVEGMVAGLPVVGSDVVGIRDVIAHERTGLLCRPRDVEVLYETLRRLVASPRLRAELGSRGRTEALRRFDESVAASKVVAIYRSLLAAKAPAETLDHFYATSRRRRRPASIS
jgi:glycosyltransferase involved in cell wall biosynthesis